MKAMNFYTANGWIFSKKQADKVKELITPTELPALPEEIYIPELAEETEQPKTLEKSSIWNNLKTLDHSLYDDYKSGLLTLEECARKFAKSGWTSFVDIEYTKAIFEQIEHQENNAPLIIEDFAKYGCVDYPTECEEMGGFKLGELVYDQCGEIGIILAFYKNDGEVRLNSNGCCDVGKLKKCPKEIAEREVKHMDIIRPQKASPAYTVEAHPLENIHLTETENFNGVCYYDVEGAGIITNAKVRADIQPGDVFNVYTAKERKYSVIYDGVSLNRSLYNALPGIIEFNNKIEARTLSPSSYYKPMGENVEFHEKKVTGKRYIVGDKPKGGYYYVVDALDNCPIDFYATKGEAEKEAERLNGFTDCNGRLRRII